jgi:hypothetical protein
MYPYRNTNSLDAIDAIKGLIAKHSRTVICCRFHQHSHYWFRAPLGPMAIFLFFPKYLCFLAWGLYSSRGGVGLCEHSAEKQFPAGLPDFQFVSDLLCYLRPCDMLTLEN